MYEFRCLSPVCRTRLTAPTKDDLMTEITRHVRVGHRVAAPTTSLLRFLCDNGVREVTYDRVMS